MKKIHGNGVRLWSDAGQAVNLAECPIVIPMFLEEIPRNFLFVRIYVMRNRWERRDVAKESSCARQINATQRLSSENKKFNRHVFEP